MTKRKEKEEKNQQRLFVHRNSKRGKKERKSHPIDFSIQPDARTSLIYSLLSCLGKVR